MSAGAASLVARLVVVIAFVLGLCLGEGRAADDLAAIKKALTDQRPTVRAKAARDLGKSGRDVDEDAIKALCPLLKDKDRLVRLATATALEMLATTAKRDAIEAAVQPLLDAVGAEEDAATRRKSLAVLIVLLDPKHAEHAAKLYPLLENKDAETATAAADALVKLGDEPAKRAVTALKKMLSSKDSALQVRAIASLGRAADAAEDLAKLLSDSKDNSVRRACCVALAGFTGEKGKPAIAALVEAMKGDGKSDKANEEVRVQAAEAIIRIGLPASESAIPALRKALLEDRNQQLRQRCVWAGFGVEDLAKHELVKPLTDVLDETGDAKRMMRYDAARVLAFGLKDKTPDRAVEVLLQMIADEKLKLTNPNAGGPADARFAAATALGWLGKKAKDDKKVIDALRKASKDRDATLKKEAQKTLKDLGVED